MRTAQLIDMITDAAALVRLPVPTTSTSPTFAQWTSWINEGAAELFNEIATACGTDAYEKTWPITVVANQTDYQLPADLFELVNVSNWLDASGSMRVPLTRYPISDEPFLQSSPPGNFGEAFRYREVGKSAQDGTDPGSIRLLPAPSAGARVVLTYIYGPKKLVQNADTFDGFAGFESYCVVFAARRYTMSTEQRERSAELMAELDRIKANVLGKARSRDAANAPRVNMTRTEMRRSFRRGRWM